MNAQELETALKDLPAIGTLVKDRAYRQIWRFALGEKAYYLKFYPHQANRLKRLARGSPAMREFQQLQMLQKANIPAPRAVAVLMGFHLNTQIGDAVILDAIEPAVTLDHYLNDLELQGKPIPNHRELARQMRTLVYDLGRAKLGHNDLHLGNFLWQDNKLYLLDGYAVHPGGLKQDEVLLLADSVARFATRTDLMRAWDLIGPGGPMPTRNPVSRRHWRKFLSRIFNENRYFGKLTDQAGWRGVFTRQFKYPRRWSPASRLQISDQDWHAAWSTLLAKMQAGELEILKRSRSGDVLAGEVLLAGQAIPVILKRPRRRYWYRYLNEIGRGGRAHRAWRKAWSLIYRNVETAWPMLMMEKRTLGYVTDSVIVFERIPGETLASIPLDALTSDQRETLFRRTGRVLRRLEQTGLYHWDAKASNWMVLDDDQCGPTPILVDVDGIRGHWGVGEGMRRLLLSMREHPQYTPADSLALCLGYAPFARVYRDE